LPSAGAYRVAHLEKPAKGTWTVHASGGGPGVAYAVVERSALTPVLLEPKTAVVGTDVVLVAAIRAGLQGEVVAPADLPADLRMDVSFEGKPPVILTDDGTNGDAVAHDGKYSARVRFQSSGDVPVKVSARNSLLDRSTEAVVKVSGSFRYSGGPIDLDFGQLTEGSESCRPLRFPADQQGTFPFELDLIKNLPSDHRLELRSATGRTAPGEAPLSVPPGAPLELCLVTSPRAPSSAAGGEPWLALRVANTTDAQQRIPINLTWRVTGLSFLQRWAWLILVLALIVSTLFVIAGFVLPKRFSAALAVAFVAERDELDEQSPQPIAQWKGVGIGFYRNARAYLHPNYRLSGSPRGAVAAIHASESGTRVFPGKGSALFRETLDDGWEPVAVAGRPGRGGDVFRVNENGPYFRLSSARRGRA
jgi:hypothetical protein